MELTNSQNNKSSRLKRGALHLARFWWANLAENEKRAKACPEPAEGLTKKAQKLIETNLDFDKSLKKLD